MLLRLIAILFAPIGRTSSDDRIDLPSNNNLSQEGFVFPHQVSLFTAVSFYIPRASFLRIRHMNRSLCSLNAEGDAMFPCRCFAFPSHHYELLIDNISTFKFSVVVWKKFWKSPSKPMLCQPMMIEFDSDIFCSGLNLSLHLQSAAPAINVVGESDELKFNTEAEMPLQRRVIFPCYHLCFPGIYRIVLVNGGRVVQAAHSRLFEAFLRNASHRLDAVAKSTGQGCNLRPIKVPSSLTLEATLNESKDLEFKMRVFAVPENSNFEQSYYMNEYDIEIGHAASCTNYCSGDVNPVGVEREA
ncbi:unnamed protein product [Litomosoides sigmodontis]|uniref:Uncharacterized protein n=1 Tax=Litomosoides sigmodontis TaxID=42156 RepID=A0A3P6U0U6_LITSI|nr:unnamed protein product [Litomosoides sigmodontis]